MSFLTQLLPAQQKQQDPSETIGRVVDRLKTSSLAEDRRAAVLALKGLVREYKLDVGTKGLGPLCTLLQDQSTDLETLKAVLETLNVLCTPMIPDGADPSHVAQDLGIQFTEIFIKDPANVGALLSILEEPDFYVRYQTVELLSTVLANNPEQLQDAVLVSPMGISRLIDLLEDRREAIRNAGLLLLITLTQTNADIQKIVAFENAFDRLMDIILEEGATDGGIVVQDCLQLCQNLLRHNVSNQNLFRESNMMQRIPDLLVAATPAPKGKGTIIVGMDDPSVAWTEQKVPNVILVLELLRILCVPNNPNTTSNQNLLAQHNILTKVIDLALAGPHVPVPVKAQSFYAVGDAIRGNGNNQNLFARGICKTSSPPKPALVVAISNALGSSKTFDDFMLRAASTYAVESYLFNNVDGQIAVASTLTPPPDDNPNSDVPIHDRPQSAGSLLLDGALYWEAGRKDPFRVWFACTLLMHVLRKNQACKEMLLGVTLHDEALDVSIPLIHKIMYLLTLALREGLDIRVQIAYLCLLIVWLYDFPKGVKEFLGEGSNLQYLIEQVKQSSGIDPLVQGLAAFLLGICFEFNDDSEPAFTRAALQPIIMSRIGVDLFVNRIERLWESKQFNRTSVSLQLSGEVDNKGLPDLWFDHMFADLFKSSHDSISKAITNIGARPKSSIEAADADSIVQYKTIIREQDKELSILKEKMKLADAEVASKQVTIDALTLELEQLKAKYLTQEQEMEDLLVYLADLELKVNGGEEDIQ